MQNLNLICLTKFLINQNNFSKNIFKQYLENLKFMIIDENYHDNSFKNIIENENFDLEDKKFFRKSIAFFKDEKKEEINKLFFNPLNLKFFIGITSGSESFGFRVTLKEYKAGLTASKYSLILNQFSIESNTFTVLINEILLNNFPLKFLNELFLNEDEFILKFQFLVVVFEKSRSLSSTTKFLILPRGFFFFHVVTKMWQIFINLMFQTFLNTFLKKFVNLGILLYLIVFYIFKIITFKFSNYINVMKFYTCEDYELEGIGFYYNFLDNSLHTYLINNLKIKYFLRYYKYKYIKYLVLKNEENFILSDELDLFYDKIICSEILNNFINLEDYLFIVNLEDGSDDDNDDDDDN